MQIKTVALIGAGAIGAYYIWGMAEKLGDDFCIVAEGDRHERLARNGITINDRHYDLNVKRPEEARGADLVIVGTKYSGLPSALPMIREIVTDQTIVMCPMNGVDSEETIGGVIDPSHLVYTLMRISSQRVGDRITFNPEATKGIFLGEKGHTEPTERILAMEELFTACNIRWNFESDIIADMWAKFSLNIATNLPQAILGVGFGAYKDSEHVNFMQHKLDDEVQAVAAAYGIHIPPLEDQSALYRKAARYSTLQDLDAGRHTEIDMFCGVLMKKAAAKGIAVPFAEYTYHLIKALEEKNDGLFEYND